MSSGYYTVMIVEDEHWAREIITDYLARFPQLKILSLISTSDELKIELQKEPYDLIFLDINLATDNALKVIQDKKRSSSVIITTARSDCSLDAYDIGVMDYLVKPISEERFIKAINRFLDYKMGGISEELIKQNENRDTFKRLFITLQKEYGLTETEAVICKRIVEGFSREEIQFQLSISEETMKSHFRKIYAKTLNFDNDSKNLTHGKMQKLTIWLQKL
ncbi:MAG: response regulator [Spirochaetia bacterium]|nr:response regulator [Spirochaetia bacterium]